MSLFNFLRTEKEITQHGFSQSAFIQAVTEGGIPLERATDRLINHFRGYPMMFAKRYGLESEEVIDAYSDAVMALITYIRVKKFDERYSISTYLYRLTKNKSIDILRAKGRGKRIQQEEIPSVQILDGDRSLLHELLMSEVLQSVLDLLDSFKNKCKELILRWGFWGYSANEIAQAMDYKSPEVVRTQKSRCLDRLRTEIDRQIDFPFPHFDS